MKKLLALLLAICLLVSCLGGCNKEPEITKYTAYEFAYFDTVSVIMGYADSQEEFDSVCEEIKVLLNEYHQLYTIYNFYESVNNIVTINALKDGEHQVIEVDRKIIDLLLYAKEMYAATDGKVNVAMGSVLKIWHNYRNAGIDDPANAELPPMDKLQEAAEHTNIDDVIIDEENSTVYLADPKMSLDVGSIAKGYAVEQIAKYLEDKGITGYLLNIGGNVRTVGPAFDKPWNVGIENPDKEDEDKPHIEFLHMAGESLVTSGNYQRYYYVDGELYHHIIDPATLMPGTNYRSVSVLTKDSGQGDALSTCLFLMSYEDGLELIESLEDVEAMWVMPDGEQKYSSGFKAYTYVPEELSK